MVPLAVSLRRPCPRSPSFQVVQLPCCQVPTAEPCLLAKPWLLAGCQEGAAGPSTAFCQPTHSVPNSCDQAARLVTRPASRSCMQAWQAGIQVAWSLPAWTVHVVEKACQEWLPELGLGGHLGRSAAPKARPRYRVGASKKDYPCFGMAGPSSPSRCHTDSHALHTVVLGAAQPASPHTALWHSAPVPSHALGHRGSPGSSPDLLARRGLD